MMYIPKYYVILENNQVAKVLMSNNIRVSVVLTELHGGVDLAKALQQWTADIAILLDGSCDAADLILFRVCV